MAETADSGPLRKQAIQSQMLGPGSLSRNVIANMVGRGWTALSYFAATPFVIHFIGIEAYGLVGFFVTLVAFSSLLELGLSTTLNRELARRSAGSGDPQAARDLVRTLELAYWGLALLMGLITVALAPLLAHHWFTHSSVSSGAIQEAITLMGVTLTCQWPLALYTGGLLGLQRQVTLNALIVTGLTLRNGGAILALWLVSPTLTTYFSWQAIAAVIQTLLTAVVLWRSLPDGTRTARFSFPQLRSVGRFALGVGGISVLIIALTQTDKFVLSNLLSLRNFGYYSLAWLAVTCISYLAQPIFQAVFPRLSTLGHAGDTVGLARTYHLSCRLMTVLVAPTALMLALFAPTILTLWLHDRTTVDHAHALVTLLAIGTACNALANVPYALALSQGWTGWALSMNLGAVALFVPTMVMSALAYGGMGAASVWAVLNAVYVIVGVERLHRRLLPTEKRAWYLGDTVLPLSLAVGVVIPSWVLMPSMSEVATVAWLVVTLSAGAALAALGALKGRLKTGLGAFGEV